MRASSWILIAGAILAIPTSPLVAQSIDTKAEITGELKQWHAVTLTIAGPSAKESEEEPNPFTDYRMLVDFAHASGEPRYTVPGYFAADGNAAETSATEGDRWRAHLSPDKPGKWTYEVSFLSGEGIALHPADLPADEKARKVPGVDGLRGSFEITASDKTGRDLRGQGRLQYVGERYLRFAGSGDYFLKAGADAPETLLAYADFDGTEARKENVPLKTYAPHLGDWRPGDPTWQGGKGKGLIGAINYLSSTGANAFSFLTYNAGGDGDNVWPFAMRDEKLNYDVSKLDQWRIVFEHAQTRGMYLHFKLQETEIDDQRTEDRPKVPEALDGGAVGPERKLYLREIIARFGHLLALNWNLGEENTQTTEEQRAMARYIRDVDSYDHHIVVHTYPDQQDKVYTPLLGDGSALTGASLQNNDIRESHWQVVKWTQLAAASGKPWVVAVDEPGDPSFGEPPDPGYQGFDGTVEGNDQPPTIHEVRKYALWGTLMAGGAGVEYYFGYRLPQNDLLCEDWRSRQRSWEYCNIALSFFRDHDVPFREMLPCDDLVGTEPERNDRYCFGKRGAIYLVYLTHGGTTQIDLPGQGSSYTVRWFDPRVGGELQPGSVRTVQAGGQVELGHPPSEAGEDWLVVLRVQRNAP